MRGQNRIELNQKFYGHGPSLVNTKSDKSDGLRIGCYDSSIVISGHGGLHGGHQVGLQRGPQGFGLS